MKYELCMSVSLMRSSNTERNYKELLVTDLRIIGSGIVQATPGLLNACVTGCDGFARNCV